MNFLQITEFCKVATRGPDVCTSAGKKQARAPFCNRPFRITQTVTRSRSTFVIRRGEPVLPNRPRPAGTRVSCERRDPDRGSPASAAGSGLVKDALPSVPECANTQKKTPVFLPHLRSRTHMKTAFSHPGPPGQVHALRTPRARP